MTILRKLATHMPKLRQILAENDRLRNENQKLRDQISGKSKLQEQLEDQLQVHAQPRSKEHEDTLADEVQHSVQNRESVKEWWENNHKKDHPFWLSGTSSQQIWSSLNINNLVLSNSIVLNIGVGLGQDTRELVNKGCIVHALDISETALERVRNFVKCVWLADQLPQLPSKTYDLAISHLVSQHMSNRDLLEQMIHVVRSLKERGIFAMQFAFPLNGHIEESNEVEGNIRCGAVLRTMEIFDQMVQKASGRIVWYRQIGTFPEYGAGWYGVHIQRLKAT
jgi:2-polyprenyl-3-methyl-5-hydroxy-6-metoxy-1,4-benzoquinol methylase